MSACVDRTDAEDNGTQAFPARQDLSAGIIIIIIMYVCVSVVTSASVPP